MLLGGSEGAGPKTQVSYKRVHRHMADSIDSICTTLDRRTTFE
jgi:hypothetical protein